MAVTLPYESEVDSTRIFENSRQDDWVAREQSAQVRIPIQITNYEKVQVRDPQNKVATKVVALKPVVQTLRARMDRTNHFYLKDYRVETIPLKWKRSDNLFTVQLNIFKRFGEYKLLEEQFANITMQGKLVGKDKLFVLHGTARITVQNKENEPEAEIIAGFGKPAQSSPVATSKKANDKSKNL